MIGPCFGRSSTNVKTTVTLSHKIYALQKSSSRTGVFQAHPMSLAKVSPGCGLRSRSMADLLNIGDLKSNYSDLRRAQANTTFPYRTIRNDAHPGLRAIPASDKAVIASLSRGAKHALLRELALSRPNLESAGTCSRKAPIHSRACSRSSAFFSGHHHSSSRFTRYSPVTGSLTSVPTAPV